MPGFNLEKAVELLPLSEPLRTQALIPLASTPSLDVKSVFALYSGDVLLQARVPLVPGDTFASIRDRSYFMTN